MNILIPNIGRRGYLVKYIKDIDDFHGKVYVSDCDTTASGLYGSNDGYFILPKPSDDEDRYVDEVLHLCEKEDIGLIIPVIDPEIFILSKYVDLFARQNILIMVSSKEVMDICYNKILMNHFLEQNDFLIPRTYDSLENFEEDYAKGKITLPVIIKPIYGSGSELTYKVSSVKAVKALFFDDCVIQEFIEGQEYGVDVFNDLNRTPIRCVVKKKIAMRSGETDKAISVKDIKLQHALIKLAEKLGHIGNLDCDVIRKNDDLYIIDLNPRLGGGYPATHESGVNLLEIMIALALGEGGKIKPEFENYKENLLVMKEVNIVTFEKG